MLIICDDNRFLYFIEYVNSVFDTYTKNKHVKKTQETMMSINKEYDTIKYIICTEQTTSYWITTITDWLNRGKIILQYSLYHVKQIPHPNHIFIPYQIKNKELDYLKNCLSRKKQYDVVFSGGMSPRRQDILNKLTSFGVNVLIVRGFGRDRDEILCLGKILLNIHFNDEYKTYESIRCDRWLMSGMMVLTENSQDDDMLDVKDLLIIEKYDNIVNKVRNVLSNYGTYYHHYKNKLIELQQNIINNRKARLDIAIEFMNSNNWSHN